MSALPSPPPSVLRAVPAGRAVDAVLQCDGVRCARPGVHRAMTLRGQGVASLSSSRALRAQMFQGVPHGPS